MVRLTRSNPSCPGWRSPHCRAAAERVLAQSLLFTAPGAQVTASLAGQLATAVRSPCFGDARQMQREAESTCRFHVVWRRSGCAPFRSCTFTIRLASGAAPTRGSDGKIKRDGTGPRKSIQKSTRHRGVHFCATRRLSSKGSQVQGSRWHRAIEQPQQSDDCASRRAFRPFRLQVRPSMIEDRHCRP
jgi:hypothetical protein